MSYRYTDMYIYVFMYFLLVRALNFLCSFATFENVIIYVRAYFWYHKHLVAWFHNVSHLMVLNSCVTFRIWDTV